jgi:hypothetical protein
MLTGFGAMDAQFLAFRPHPDVASTVTRHDRHGIYSARPRLLRHDTIEARTQWSAAAMACLPSAGYLKRPIMCGWLRKQQQYCRTTNELYSNVVGQCWTSRVVSFTRTTNRATSGNVDDRLLRIVQFNHANPLTHTTVINR